METLLTGNEKFMSSLGWIFFWIVMSMLMTLGLLTLRSFPKEITSHQSKIWSRSNELCFIFPVCKDSQDVHNWFAHPKNFGRLQALGDIKGNRTKWYMYGLIPSDNQRYFEDRLASMSIKLFSRGCVIGTPEYERDMAYNEVVKKQTSIEATLPTRAFSLEQHNPIQYAI